MGSAVFSRSAACIAADVTVVPVLVVADMICTGAVLMGAIGRHGRPAELERQESEKDDGEKAMHGHEV
jgi:hypothetical protein